MVCAACCALRPAAGRAADLALPAWRLSPDGWGKAAVGDVKAVLESAMSELWRFFPGRKLEPVFVTRGYDVPVVYYKRNAMKEIVVRLDTADFYWCQYAYQFAHEFCHILCGFDDDWKGNLWFEESLCETASLFVLRRMAQTWAKSPPFESWRSYAPRFAEYVLDIMDRRVSITDSRLPGFYQRHKADLVRTPTDRELNGTISLSLLRLLEAVPSYWEAITWLNSSPSPPGESFTAYLAKWHNATPERCRPFVNEIIKRFGVNI